MRRGKRLRCSLAIWKLRQFDDLEGSKTRVTKTTPDASLMRGIVEIQTRIISKFSSISKFVVINESDTVDMQVFSEIREHVMSYAAMSLSRFRQYYLLVNGESSFG